VEYPPPVNDIPEHLVKSQQEEKDEEKEVEKEVEIEIEVEKEEEEKDEAGSEQAVKIFPPKTPPRDYTPILISTHFGVVAVLEYC